MLQSMPRWVWFFVVFFCGAMGLYFCVLIGERVTRWIDIFRMKRRMKILEQQVNVRLAELEETIENNKRRFEQLQEQMEESENRGYLQ
jgi:predicted ATP-grasp superfamily ATP-dependent carboligase